VYLIGAEPGAPDLNTIRGVKVLTAPISFTTTPWFIQKSWRLRDAPEKYQWGSAAEAFPLTNVSSAGVWVEANSQYKVVARLKGGDTMLFQRSYFLPSAPEQMASPMRSFQVYAALASDTFVPPRWA